MYRYTHFKSRLSTLFTNEREESLSLDKIMEYMKTQDFSQKEINGGLTKMENDGKIFRAEGIIFLI